MEVGEIIIDDPLARLPEEAYTDLGVDDKTEVCFFVGGNPVLAESVKIGTDRALEFAKKFCEQNADLLKRLADK